MHTRLRSAVSFQFQAAHRGIATRRGIIRRICTDPLEELLNLIRLDFGRCPLLVAIPNESVNPTLFYCYSCLLLVSIPNELVNHW